MHALMGSVYVKLILCMEEIRAISEFVMVSQVNGKVSSYDLLLNRDFNISAIEIA